MCIKNWLTNTEQTLHSLQYSTLEDKINDGNDGASGLYGTPNLVVMMPLITVESMGM